MRGCARYVLVFMLVVILVGGIAGTGWTLPNPYVSWVTCDTPGLEYTNRLTATVTQNLDGTYHFQYVLEFLEDPFGTGLSDFSIGNLDYLPVTNPYCSHPRSDDWFDNTTESIYWYTSDVATGTNVTFSFDTVYSYTMTNVTVGASGFPSGGDTLGMRIPEPASTAVVIMGLGAVWAKIRRRRR